MPFLGFVLRDRLNLGIAVKLAKLFQDECGFRHSLSWQAHITRLHLIISVLLKSVAAPVNKDWSCDRGDFSLDLMNFLVVWSLWTTAIILYWLIQRLITAKLEQIIKTILGQAVAKCR